MTQTPITLAPDMRSGGLKTGLFCIALACCVTVISYTFLSSYTVNLSDGGFLWYGTQRTALGETPLQDFQSYDPGRYYWGAAWMGLLGDTGLATTKIAAGIFQGLGLCMALVMLARMNVSRVFLILASLVLTLWMYPYHKYYDHATSLFLVCATALLLEKPSRQRAVFLGGVIGLCAFMGRNHGVYGVAGAVLAYIVLLNKLPGRKGMFLWLCTLIGIAIGYAPMLYCIVLKPGFYDSFIESIIITTQKNNGMVPLPMPWPWRATYAGLPYLRMISNFLIGSVFIVLMLTSAMAVLLSVWLGFFKKRAAFQETSDSGNGRIHATGFGPWALLLGALMLTPVYMHYAAERSEAAHLAQSLMPFLMTLLAAAAIIKRKHIKILILITMILVSVLATGPYHPRIGDALLKRPVHACPIGNSIYFTDNNTFQMLSAADTVSKQMKPDDNIFIAPNAPALYSVLQRKSPVWETYSILGASEEEQGRQIEQIRSSNVQWLILSDRAFDGRRELKFSQTHALLWDYLMSRYTPVASSFPKQYKLYRRMSQQ